jgi:hypothetical protein
MSWLFIVGLCEQKQIEVLVFCWTTFFLILFQVQYTLISPASRTLEYNTNQNIPINLPCILYGYKPEPSPEPKWKNSNGLLMDKALTRFEKNDTYKVTYLYYDKIPERRYNGTYTCFHSEDVSQTSITQLQIKCISYTVF